MAKTAAQKNREMRQNSLRELIRAQKHEQYVVDNIHKIEELASIEDPDGANVRAVQVSGLKTATEMRLRLINKYIPDVKSVTAPVEFDFDTDSAASQARSILKAAAEGIISPDVAQQLANAMKAALDIEANTELKARIEKLEDMLNAQSG